MKHVSTRELSKHLHVRMLLLVVIIVVIPGHIIKPQDDVTITCQTFDCFFIVH